MSGGQDGTQPATDPLDGQRELYAARTRPTGFRRGCDARGPDRPAARATRPRREGRRTVSAATEPGVRTATRRYTLGDSPRAPEPNRELQEHPVTDPVVEDSRVIDIFADVYNATLVHRVGPDVRPRLLLRQDGRPGDAVQPGQYMTTGVLADGKMLQRPYSVASAPADRRHRGLRAVRAARAHRPLHHRAVAPPGRPPDAHDRPQGQVHAGAGRHADAPVRVDRNRASRPSSR